VLVRAALGSDDNVISVDLLVDQRELAVLAGLAALGGENQRGNAVLPVMALRTVGLLVAAYMLVTEKHEKFLPFNYGKHYA
jgi:hypothetical protein